MPRAWASRGDAWGGFWVVVVLTLLVAWLSVAGAYQAHGRNVSEHAGPVPAGVARVDADTYIAPVAVPLERICAGSAETDGAVGSTAYVRDLKANLVECSVEQSWDVPGPREPSYSSQLALAPTRPAFVGIVGGTVLFMFWLGPLGYIIDDRREGRRRVDMAEEKRLALTDAYAQGRITDQQFEDRLGDVLREL